MLESNLRFDVDEQNHPERWIWGTVSLRAFFGPDDLYVFAATGGIASHADARQALDRIAPTVEMPPMPRDKTFGQSRIDRVADSFGALMQSMTFAGGMLALVFGLVIYDKQKRKRLTAVGAAPSGRASPHQPPTPAAPVRDARPTHETPTQAMSTDNAPAEPPAPQDALSSRIASNEANDPSKDQ
jgi:hypothetical protein